VLPGRPTKALPGGKEKLKVMQERAARGEALFHPEDARLTPSTEDDDEEEEEEEEGAMSLGCSIDRGRRTRTAGGAEGAAVMARGGKQGRGRGMILHGPPCSDREPGGRCVCCLLLAWWDSAFACAANASSFLWPFQVAGSRRRSRQGCGSARRATSI